MPKGNLTTNRNLILKDWTIKRTSIMFTEKYDYLQYRFFLLNKYFKKILSCAKSLHIRVLIGWLLLGYFCPFLIFFNSNGPKHAMYFCENKNISSNFLFKSVRYYIHGKRRGKVGRFTEHRHTNTLLYQKYKCNWWSSQFKLKTYLHCTEHKEEQEESAKEWWPVCRSTHNQVCSSKK